MTDLLDLSYSAAPYLLAVASIPAVLMLVLAVRERLARRGPVASSPTFATYEDCLRYVMETGEAHLFVLDERTGRYRLDDSGARASRRDGGGN